MPRCGAIGAVLVLAGAAAARAAAIDLPRTGQTACYSEAGAAIPCAGSGQDGEHRAGLAWPDPRFTVTYCSAGGPCASQSADCDANAADDVIEDHLTGLTWTRSGGGSAAPVTWSAALGGAAARRCGLADWRVPNAVELESLAHGGQASTIGWLGTQGFIDVNGTMPYWSSTTDPMWDGGWGNDAWGVAMPSGSLGLLVKTDASPVWYVRGTTAGATPLRASGQAVAYAAGDDGDLEQGVPWPTPRFRVTYCDAASPCLEQAHDCDNSPGNDVVTDQLTGLVWTRSASIAGGSRGWAASLAFVNGLGLCGHDDWRLPNRIEMFTLHDSSRRDPALPAGHPFIDLQAAYYWTSTTLLALPSAAVAVHLTDHMIAGMAKTEPGIMLWPVRGGQVVPPVRQLLLSVERTGDGRGSVTSDPAGIDCGATCGAGFDEGSSVALTPHAAAGSTFVSWTGCTSITGSVCHVTMDLATAVGVRFALIDTGIPKIAVTPAALNFGKAARDAHVAKTLTIRNTGFGELEIAPVQIGGPAQGEYAAANSCPPITRGTSCLLLVQFTAAAFGTRNATLTITSNDPKKPSLNVALKGVAPPPKLAGAPGSINFGKVKAGGAAAVKRVTLRNAGTSALEFSAIGPEGSAAFGRATACSTLAKGATCTVDVTFAPLAAGAASGTLVIESNDPAKPRVTIRLSGAGS